MTAMDLRKAVLQEVVSLLDDDAAMQRLLDFLLSLKHADGQASIVGLPYTRQERQEALLRAEEEVMAGHVSTHEEVVVRIKERIEAWK